MAGIISLELNCFCWKSGAEPRNHLDHPTMKSVTLPASASVYMVVAARRRDVQSFGTTVKRGGLTAPPSQCLYDLVVCFLFLVFFLLKSLNALLHQCQATPTTSAGHFGFVSIMQKSLRVPLRVRWGCVTERTRQVSQRLKGLWADAPERAFCTFFFFIFFLPNIGCVPSHFTASTHGMWFFM